MKIFFTGVSSFTGFWFVKYLLDAGHEVTATCTREELAYEGVRADRINMLQDVCEIAFGCSFGDDKFIDIINNQGKWDLFCHHGAFVGNYKDVDFDIASAFVNNTGNLPKVIESLAGSGCNKVLLTGSYFEAGEGGQDNLSSFSPYGLSKSFTTMAFRHHCLRNSLGLGHFVIPNPFGPYEDERPRFTTYLMQQWKADLKASVLTPQYIRDNIHVRLLAQAYTEAASKIQDGPAFQSFRPSCYVETQGLFAQRVAEQTRRKTQLKCTLLLEKQKSYNEASSLANTDMVVTNLPDFSEEMLWDEFIDYFLI